MSFIESGQLLLLIDDAGAAPRPIRVGPRCGLEAVQNAPAGHESCSR